MPKRFAAGRAAALAVGFLLAAGCDPADVQIRSATHVLPGRSVRGDDHYVGIRGKKKGPTGEAFMQTPPEVWAPFDVSIHMGLFDPARKTTANGVTQCIEIDNVGFSIFFDVCGTYDAGTSGWDVSAHYGLPFTFLPGSLFVGGDELELRVAEAGGTLTFYGRPAGGNTWMEVANMPYPAVAEPLHASFGVNALAKGTEVGFDDPSLTTSPPGDVPSAERVVAGSANAALLSGLAAYVALDAGRLDFANAATAMGNAQDALGNAQTQLAGLPQSSVTKKAAKAFGKCAKKLAAASGHVAAQDADHALADLEKAARGLAPGLLALVPEPPTHFP